MKYFRGRIKWVSILVLVVVIVASFVVAQNVFNPAETQACRDQGNNAAFWRTLEHELLWVGHYPSDALRTRFSGADTYGLGDTSLHNTLWSIWPFDTSNPVDYAARKLLKDGVAALLNASHPSIDYHFSGTQVRTMVNDALASGNPATMDNLRNTLCQWNDVGSPLGP